MNQKLPGTNASQTARNPAGPAPPGKNSDAAKPRAPKRRFPRVTAQDAAKLERFRERLEEEHPGDSDARATLF